MSGVYRQFLEPYTVEGALSELLMADDGHPLTVREAMEHSGNLRVLRVALEAERQKRYARPLLRGYPPKVFIHYRWGDEQQQAWVRRLAAAVRDLGYDVFIDQEHAGAVGPEGMGIATFVSAISDSQVFLTVISERYADDWVRDWLIEEMQIARMETRYGRIALISVWQAGDNIPEDIKPNVVVDLRADVDDFGPLAEQLPPYDDLRLSQAQQDGLMDILDEADRHIEADDFDAADAVLHRQDALAPTEEIRQRLAHVAAGRGDCQRAWDLIHEVLRNGRPSTETWVDLTLLLYHMEEWPTALRELIELRRLPGYQRLALGVMGDALDEIGSYRPALNFYAAAALRELDDRPPTDDDRSGLLGNIGFVWLHRLDRPDMALPALREAVALNPANEAAARMLKIAESAPAPADPPTPAGTNYGCDTCGARYHVDPDTERLCGGCGTAYPSEHGHCPSCGRTGIVPIALAAEGLVGCLTCRMGQVSIAADG